MAMRPVRRPSIADLPEQLRRAAAEVAERIEEGTGARAWIVGGAVRDLALGRQPHDADLASAARPDEIEPLFERTVGVGKAFGTLVVPHLGCELQVTTFRSERGYSDARRPDEVVYGETLEEDARRRDFTCNALYLDPRSDALADPTGGLADLQAGRLRCVGEPRRRFAEDGLRLLRLARFAAGLDLSIQADTLAAARGSAERVRGVSPERVLAELERIAAGADSGRAMTILAGIGVLERILPLPAADLRTAVEAAPRLGSAPGLPRLLALFFLPSFDRDRDAARQALRELRASRELLRGVEEIAGRVAQIRRALQREAEPSRAERVRLARDAVWEDALAVLLARDPGAGGRRERLERWRAEARSLSPEERFPAPLLSSADLAAAGVPDGPLFGRLLREAEDLRLEGAHETRADALAWLARRSGRASDAERGRS